MSSHYALVCNTTIGRPFRKATSSSWTICRATSDQGRTVYQGGRSRIALSAALQADILRDKFRSRAISLIDLPGRNARAVCDQSSPQPASPPPDSRQSGQPNKPEIRGSLFFSTPDHSELRSNKPSATPISSSLGLPESMRPPKPNSVEPPWYGTRMPGGVGGVAFARRPPIRSWAESDRSPNGRKPLEVELSLATLVWRCPRRTGRN